MGKDTLKISMSLPLLKALGFSEADDRPLDYFELMGTRRDDVDTSNIDQQLKERTRRLRQWQNSPQYGREVVRLLPILHRAAMILKDPRRREAYRRELELEEKGETAGSAERFRELARVALIGSDLTPGDRRQLAEFGTSHGLSTEQMREIIEQVRREYEASRKRDTPEFESNWEFRLAGDDEQSFLITLKGLQQSGNHLGLSTRKLVEDAMSYGIELKRAQELVKQQQTEWFKDVVRMVAGDGAINEMQARLLLTKAGDYGLSEQEAWNAISEYSLSAVASDALRRQFELAEETYSSSDINEIIHEGEPVQRRHSLWQRLTTVGSSGYGRQSNPMQVWKVAGIGMLVVAGGGYALWSLSRSGRSEVAANPPVGINVTQPVDGQEGDENGYRPSNIVATEATDDETVVDTETASRPEIPPLLPDPANGLLRLEPKREGDPPAFEILIHEVTNEEYSRYIKSVMEPPPPGWPANGDYPPGRGEEPVTNITWQEAQGYCLWVADRNGWPAGSVRLPRLDEFRRALRGVTIRGHGDPTRADYWEVARLGRASGPGASRANTWDRIILAGQGQVYDLVGNVAEWGDDERGQQRLVYGGSFNDSAPDFDATQPRWINPTGRAPWIGFRYVRELR